ncbi:MAG: nuclear transport factor 2 family protein [Alphaproteobacteria bacterium]|nr:nuclear transport factor 2 family protein [Alphaproteobacteria bacterium]
MTEDDLLALEEIRTLRHLYSHYYDGGEVDRLANLFTEDAVCEFGPGYGGDWVGREAIHANYRHFMSRYGGAFNVMHAVTNPAIVLTSGDRATGRWYLLDLRVAEGTENPLILFGIYDDEYRKRDGRWLIHRTRLHFLWPKRDMGAFRA